jgi:hypothetical protein
LCRFFCLQEGREVYPEGTQWNSVARTTNDRPCVGFFV